MLRSLIAQVCPMIPFTSRKFCREVRENAFCPKTWFCPLTWMPLTRLGVTLARRPGFECW